MKTLKEVCDDPESTLALWTEHIAPHIGAPRFGVNPRWQYQSRQYTIGGIRNGWRYSLEHVTDCGNKPNWWKFEISHDHEPIRLFHGVPVDGCVYEALVEVFEKMGEKLARAMRMIEVV